MDSIRWNEWSSRFHGDQLQLTDELVAEVRNELLAAGVEAEDVESHLTAFREVFNARTERSMRDDGRLYDGQRRPTELYALWRWFDRFDNDGRFNSMAMSRDVALGHDCPPPSDDMSLSERMMRVVRPRMQNDISMRDRAFANYFSRGEFDQDAIQALLDGEDAASEHARAALQEVGLLEAFRSGRFDSTPSYNEALRLFRSAESDADRDGRSASAVLAFLPHDDEACADHTGGSQLTSMGRAMLVMESVFHGRGAFDSAILSAREAARRSAVLGDQTLAERAGPPVPRPPPGRAGAEEERALRDGESPRDAAEDGALVGALVDGGTAHANEPPASPTDADSIEGTPPETAADVDTPPSAVDADALIADADLEDDAVPPRAVAESIPAADVDAVQEVVDFDAITEAPRDLPAWLNERQEELDIGDRVTREDFERLLEGHLFDMRSTQRSEETRGYAMSGIDPNDLELIETVGRNPGGGLLGTSGARLLDAASQGHVLSPGELFEELELRMDSNGNRASDGRRETSIDLRDEDGRVTPAGQIVAILGRYRTEVETVDALGDVGGDVAFDFKRLDTVIDGATGQTVRDRLIELGVPSAALRPLTGLGFGVQGAQQVFDVLETVDHSGAARHVIRSTARDLESEPTRAGAALALFEQHVIVSLVEGVTAQVDPAVLDDVGEPRPIEMPRTLSPELQSLVGLRVGGAGASEEQQRAAQSLVAGPLNYDISDRFSTGGAVLANDGIDGDYGRISHAAAMDAVALWNMFTGSSVPIDDDELTAPMLLAMQGMIDNNVLGRLPESLRRGVVVTDVYDRPNRRVSGTLQPPRVMRTPTHVSAPNATAPVLLETQTALALSAFNHTVSERGLGDFRVTVSGNSRYGHVGQPHAWRPHAMQALLFRHLPRGRAYSAGNSRHQSGYAIDGYFTRDGHTVSSSQAQLIARMGSL
ncbi:MAG: hypothetical protein AAF605_09035, partial [Myxococcota bacterium]